MPRLKQQSKKSCIDHYFFLEPLLSECYFQEPIKANLCRDFPKSKGSSKKNCYEGPVYNKDKLSSTPTFVIKSEKQKFLTNPARWQNENEQKYFNIVQSKSQMLVPKPSSKSFYCNVCKEKYEDYLQHVRNDKHKNKIRTNSYSRHILRLSNKYQKIRNAGQCKDKQNTLATVSEFQNVIIIDQDSQKQLSKPRKKAKLENSNLKNQYCNIQAPLTRATTYYQPPQFLPQMNNYYPLFNGMTPYNNIPPCLTYLHPYYAMYNQNNLKYYKPPYNLYYNNQIPYYNTLQKPPEPIQPNPIDKAHLIVIQDEN